jgi:hypothetical protein
MHDHLGGAAHRLAASRAVGGGGSTASAVSLGWGLSVAGALAGRDDGHPALWRALRP